MLGAIINDTKWKYLVFDNSMPSFEYQGATRALGHSLKNLSFGLWDKLAKLASDCELRILDISVLYRNAPVWFQEMTTFH